MVERHWALCLSFESCCSFSSKVAVEGSPEGDRTRRCGGNPRGLPLLRDHVAAFAGSGSNLCRLAPSVLQRHGGIDTKTPLTPTAPDRNPKVPRLHAGVRDDEAETTAIGIDSGRALLPYGKCFQSIFGFEFQPSRGLSTHHPTHHLGSGLRDKLVEADG